MTPDLFYQFAQEMTNLLGHSLDSYKDQERLLDELCAFETKFKKELVRTKRGKKMFARFMNFILNDKKNILAARIYFRERQNTFSKYISKAFDEEKPNQLIRFRVNYWFANWVVNAMERPNKKLLNILDKMKGLRTQLCETNLPLAVNRAKIFWARSQERQLEYMDLIQACAEGLLNAIDKFVPPYRDVFKSTAIGRMVSNMIDDHNATLVKFSPQERRIIYRARIAVTKKHLLDKKAIILFVQESFPDATEEIIDRLIHAASDPTSMSVATDDRPDWDQLMPAKDDVEAEAIDVDLKQKLVKSMHLLSNLERKVLATAYGINND